MKAENNKELERSLIKFLLTDDIPHYKKYLKNISKFDDEEIENLYLGNLKFNFRSVNFKERSFQYLLIKFDKFGSILESWYQNETRYVFLKQLWKKNPNFEDLKNLNENQREEKLPFITQWPNEIKNEFNQIIDNYISNDDILVVKIKEYLEGQGKECKELLEYIIEAIKKVKEKKTSKKTEEKFIQNANNVLYQIIMLIILPGGGLATSIDGGSENTKGLSKKGFDSILEYCRNNSKNALENIVSLTKKAFKNKKFTAGAILALSLVNLAYSICEFNEISKEIDKKEVYKERLERIKKSFENNSDPKLDYKDDISFSNEKIRKAVDAVLKDFDDLIKLISDIEASIKKIKQQEKKAWASTAISIVGFIGSVTAAALTVGDSIRLASTYFVGAGINAASGVVNIEDIVKACEGIEQLKEVLKEAIEQRKIMEEKLNELLSKEKMLHNECKKLKFDG